jgi:hypothetical protein
MNDQTKEYLLKLLTILGQAEHLPRVKVASKKGEPKIKCHCQENPTDRMSIKTEDRRNLIDEGYKLLYKEIT